MEMTLNGIILSGGWSIGVVLINFIKEHKINALAVDGCKFCWDWSNRYCYFKNPTFYLVSPIIKDILIALIFFGSLFLKRSLIQVIVEQSYLKKCSRRF